MDVRDTAEYQEFGFSVVTCPRCGGETLDNYFICPTCGWEYDGVTEGYSSCNGATVETEKKE